MYNSVDDSPFTLKYTYCNRSDVRERCLREMEDGWEAIRYEEIIHLDFPSWDTRIELRKPQRLLTPAEKNYFNA